MTPKALLVTSLAVAVAPPLVTLAAGPIGTSIDIHAGSNATPEANILVSLTATDDQGVTGYFLSQNASTPSPASFTSVTSTPSFAADVPFTLVGGYGLKTVYAWFIDQDDTISQPLFYRLQYLDKAAVVDQAILDGSTSTDYGVEVTTGPLGDLYVTGFRFSNPYFGGGDRAYVAKYDAATLSRDWGASYSSSGGVGTGLTQGVDIAVDGTGACYTVGYDLVDVQGDVYYYEGFVVKHSSGGIEQWAEPLANDGTRTYGLGVALGPSGNVFVVGRTDGTFPGQVNAGGNDLYIAKLSAGGVLQWVKQYGTSWTDSARDIAIDASGNLYVVGQTGGPLFGATQPGPAGYGDIFLAKLDAGGNEIWTRLMGTERSGESGEEVELAGGLVYVTGYSKDDYSGDTKDVFLARYTTAGDEVWTRMFNGHTFASHEDAFGLAVDAKGEAYLVGSTFDPIDGNIHLGGYDLTVIKYDTEGTRLFSFTYGTANSDRAFGATLADDGRLVVTGYVEGEVFGQPWLGHADLLLMTLDLEAISSSVHHDGFESGSFTGWSSHVP